MAGVLQFANARKADLAAAAFNVHLRKLNYPASMRLVVRRARQTRGRDEGPYSLFTPDNAFVVDAEWQLVALLPTATIQAEATPPAEDPPGQEYALKLVFHTGIPDVRFAVKEAGRRARKYPYRLEQQVQNPDGSWRTVKTYKYAKRGAAVQTAQLSLERLNQARQASGHAQRERAEKRQKQAA